MSQVTIQEVLIEDVKKGRSSFYKATVVYTNDKGENHTKTIVSFSNPAVFDAMKNAVQGDKFDVKAVKEGDYWNWASVTKVVAGASSVTPAPSVGGGKVTGSNYETPDERKIKQLYIIKQSSISNAIEHLKATRPGGEFAVQDVLEIAQDFVDFVYGNELAADAAHE